MLRHTFETEKNGSRGQITMGGRRVARSLRPMAESMEGRQLMTVLYSNSASAVEHGKGPVTMEFQVNLAPVSTQPVTVSYQTTNNSAIGGTDYVSTSGTVTFAPGTTTMNIPVTLLPNLAATQNMSFYFSLSGARGAFLVTPKLLGNIVEQNTPPPPSMSISNEVVNVGVGGVGGAMTFIVKLNEPVGTPVTVTASTANLTAVAGVDYVAKSQVLTFAPGLTTAQFTVTIFGETKVATKYLLVGLTMPSVAIAGPAQAAGTIVW